MIQVLIDADNLVPARLAALLRVLPDEAEVVVAGAAEAVTAVRWPPTAAVHTLRGWQAADVALMQAYRPEAESLVIASNDGDFAHLAQRHRGPVLVVADRPARRLREAGTVVDPVRDGLDALRHWFDAVVDAPWTDDRNG